MKFIAEEKTKEKTIKLWLEDDGDKVILKGMDKDRMSKNIMVFGDGKFSLSTNAQLDGLETDEEGRIKKEEK